jgi:hypothetical protein
VPFPTTAAPSLSNWQVQFNGLTMGAGTPYGLVKIDGLDLPKIRGGDLARPRDHGELAGLDLLGGRDVTITGDFVADGTSLQHAGQALGTAFAPAPRGTTEVPLWFQEPGLPVLALMCRARKRSVPRDLSYSMGLAMSAVSVHATDPRLYGAPQTATVGLGTPLGGMTFPAAFPLSFGGGTVAGVITANNGGNFEMRPLLTIAGPCTNPVVVNATAGWQLALSNPTQTGYTVLAGDTLVIDTDLHTVQYFVGGTGTGAARRAWVVPGSTWPSAVSGVGGLVPGNNTLQFTSGDSSAVAGTLTAQWASGYLI